MKMRRLICVWRAELRAAPPVTGGHAGRGRAPTGVPAEGQGLPPCGQQGRPPPQAPRGPHRTRGRGPGAGSLRASLPHQDRQEDREAQDPPEAHVIVARPAPAGRGRLRSRQHPLPPPMGGLVSALGEEGRGPEVTPILGQARSPPPPLTIDSAHSAVRPSTLRPPPALSSGRPILTGCSQTDT